MKKLSAFLITLLGMFTIAAAATFSTPGSDFALIKGGTFSMGSPESEDWRSNDETQHSVTVASFYMAKFEVTQKEWREITGKNPSNFTGDKLPVESVTWLEAIEFCNALSKRDGRTPVYAITDGGGRFGQSLTAISKLAPKAILTASLSIHYSGGSSLSKDVEKWLKKVQR